MSFKPRLILAVLALGSSLAQAGASVEVSTPPPPPTAEEVRAGKLDAAVDGFWRSSANSARDRHRHPGQTLTFFGVDSDMTVVEITPGGGWYAEILAPYLREEGHYIGIMLDPSLENNERRAAYYQKQLDDLRAKFEANPAQYDKAELRTIDPGQISLGEPGSADRVLTFRNVHNWVSAGNAQAMFNAFFDVLKPGGVLGVVEHRAPVPKKLGKGKMSHQPGPDSGYVDPRSVLAYAREAGFVLEDSSEINANERDTHDHPEGVWTLPPTLRLGDTDREKYIAIGESDRMTLRFVKPDKAK
ncbi:MAG: methyltransferase [Lysobacteraceae bacterium]